MGMIPTPGPGRGAIGGGAQTVEDLLRLIEELDEGIVVLDRDWRITYANGMARAISRIEDGHIGGASHWELYPATVGTRQEQIYRRSMEERISLEMDLYYPPFDVWIALRTIPVESGIAVAYRDITRLKRAESTRDANARKLEDIFAAMTDGVVSLDRAYTITFLNRRAEELLAASGDVLGKNLWKSFPLADYAGSPFRENYARTLEERVATRFEAYYPEPLNAWLSVEARPAEDGGMVVFFRDVSERRSKDEELERKTREMARQAAEIETVYRTAPIGLALFDPVEFRYLRLNDRQAAFFGLRPEEIVGRTLTEMAPIEGLRELFEQVRDGTPVVNFPLEGALVSDPREHRYWTVNYSPVRAANGSVQAISAASLEITAQKRAEKALLQSEKLAAVGRLASSISHEINNPLESVVNLLYLVQQEELTPAARHYVELTQAEIGRVVQISTQTLRFHRQTARPTLATTMQLLQPVIKLYQGRLANSGIKVEEDFRDETQVCCLQNEMRQVVSNLIGNAIDAMRGGGRLVLRGHRAVDAASGRPGLRVLVGDTGQGMSAATKARIFEPFYTTKEANGTGLGLWISQEIVERHGGRLTVRSSQHSRLHGTVFSLFLPLESALVGNGPAGDGGGERHSGGGVSGDGPGQ